MEAQSTASVGSSAVLGAEPFGGREHRGQEGSVQGRVGRGVGILLRAVPSLQS